MNNCETIVYFIDLFRVHRMFRYHPIVWLLLGSLTVSKNVIVISRAESNFITVVVFHSFSFLLSVLKDIIIHSRESVCLENQIVVQRNIMTVNLFPFL